MGSGVTNQPPRALRARHRQVLEFVATWLDEEGYLPSLRQVAASCGLRSPSSARRVLLELEAAGLIERDVRYPRLGVVHDAADADARQAAECELALCELAMCEIESSIELGRRAVLLAPDITALEQTFAEGLDRVLLLRTYGDARDRLVRSGVKLERDLVDAVRAHRASTDERLALVVSWEDYRTWLLLSQTMLGVYLDHMRNMGVIHLRAAYEAELGAGQVRRHRFSLDDVEAELAGGDRRRRRFVDDFLAATATDAALVLAALPKELRASIEPIFGLALATISGPSLRPADETGRSPDARAAGRERLVELPAATVAPDRKPRVHASHAHRSCRP